MKAPSTSNSSLPRKVMDTQNSWPWEFCLALGNGRKANIPASLPPENVTKGKENYYFCCLLWKVPILPLFENIP